MTGRVRLGLIAGAGALALVLAVVISRDDRPVAAAAPRATRGSPKAAAADRVPVADVKLELLSHAPAELGDVERNLFRFASRVARALESGAAAPRPAPPPQPQVAPTPGSVAPPAIPLRYIGLLEAPSLAGRVGILSDGRGGVFYAREGDTIEGRYLVLQLGPVSMELSYLDGRGRQTIRLSGQ